MNNQFKKKLFLIVTTDEAIIVRAESKEKAKEISLFDTDCDVIQLYDNGPECSILSIYPTIYGSLCLRHT
ncbi:MAG: hypothetical protein ACFFG0_08240 [Candidatus Thorarchaeota archaeon]